MKPRPRRGHSTAAVLWLMILIVFVPIVAAHGIASLLVPEPREDVQAR